MSGWKMQNSRVMTAGDHEGEERDFYGITPTRIKNGKFLCSAVTGIIFKDKAAWINYKCMINGSGASTFPVYVMRMISISWQPRQEKCFMCQTHH